MIVMRYLKNPSVDVPSVLYNIPSRDHEHVLVAWESGQTSGSVGLARLGCATP